MLGKITQFHMKNVILLQLFIFYLLFKMEVDRITDVIFKENLRRI